MKVLETCPQCSGSIEMDEQFYGQKILCPLCQLPITINKAPTVNKTTAVKPTAPEPQKVVIVGVQMSFWAYLIIVGTVLFAVAILAVIAWLIEAIFQWLSSAIFH